MPRTVIFTVWASAVQQSCVNSQTFFVSVDNFLNSFDFHEYLESIVINLTHTHLWYQSAVDVVNKVVLHFRRRSIKVNLIGLNEASATLVERLNTHSSKQKKFQDGRVIHEAYLETKFLPKYSKGLRLTIPEVY